jgi:hypothetical protein
MVLWGCVLSGLWWWCCGDACCLNFQAGRLPAGTGFLQAVVASVLICELTSLFDCRVDFTHVMSPIFSLILSVGCHESKHMHVCVHAHMHTHAHTRCCWTSGVIVTWLNIAKFSAKFHCSLHIERRKMWTASGALVPFCYYIPSGVCVCVFVVFDTGLSFRRFNIMSPVRCVCVVFDTGLSFRRFNIMSPGRCVCV